MDNTIEKQDKSMMATMEAIYVIYYPLLHTPHPQPQELILMIIHLGCGIIELYMVNHMNEISRIVVDVDAYAQRTEKMSLCDMFQIIEQVKRLNEDNYGQIFTYRCDRAIECLTLRCS